MEYDDPHAQMSLENLLYALRVLEEARQRREQESQQPEQPPAKKPAGRAAPTGRAYRRTA